jgi:hypothetical protein
MPFYAFDSNAPGTPTVHVDVWIATRTARGNPTCGCCGSIFTIVAANSPGSTTHFAHPKGAQCPLMAVYAVPYVNLATIPKNAAAAAALRTSFNQNVERAFNKCSSIAQNLSFSEFRTCFDNLHMHNAWEYNALSLEYIPYVLLCFTDLFSARRHYRPDDFYFMLEPRPNLGDLWIRPHITPQRILQVFPVMGRVVHIPILNDLLTYPANVPAAFNPIGNHIRTRL